MLSDVELVERRLDKTRKAARSGDKAAKHELEVLEALDAALLDGKLAKRIERAADDAAALPRARARERPARALRAQHRRRPGAPAPRSSEHGGVRGRGRATGATRWSPSPRASRPSWRTSSPTRRREFRAELGADEAGTLDVVIRAAYEVLGYITFFTGDFRSSESRAWQLPRGWTAKQAAGRIHSDIEHGFVRAQVVGIDELHRAGLVPRRAREGAAAHRRQGVRRPGRRRDQLHAHGLRPGAATASAGAGRGSVAQKQIGPLRPGLHRVGLRDGPAEPDADLPAFGEVGGVPRTPSASRRRCPPSRAPTRGRPSWSTRRRRPRGARAGVPARAE